MWWGWVRDLRTGGEEVEEKGEKEEDGEDVACATFGRETG